MGFNAKSLVNISFANSKDGVSFDTIFQFVKAKMQISAELGKTKSAIDCIFLHGYEEQIKNKLESLGFTVFIPKHDTRIDKDKYYVKISW